jgi:hypothetical protein
MRALAISMMLVACLAAKAAVLLEIDLTNLGASTITATSGRT